jgi:signal transduction histidine kinase
MRVEELRGFRLFDGLSDEQIGALVDGGSEERVEPGVELFHEGDHADSWWLLVEGAIELSRHVGHEIAVVGRIDVPGRWAGGFRAWDEHGVYLATGRGVVEGRVLRVPAEVLGVLSDTWFPFGGHLIRGVYGTARSIEATARQKESLVALGTLSAGLAHELNNPAAAATRAVDALHDACDTLLSSLALLAQNELSPQQFSALDDLRLEIEPPTSPQDPLDVADREDALASWLGRHDVTRDWALASALAAAGVDTAWCERALLALGESNLAPGLEWVTSTVSAATLLSEVKESTRRVSDLVAAVKSYSQMDRASVQTIDVTEGLETTLVMLGHKLRDLRVVREYDAELPRIEAYPGELNQVWTNLIDNAADAMTGEGAGEGSGQGSDEGTLRITTSTAGENVVVAICDTGPGMPPEVVARAFEAFYTTKDVGKGTGLGLDIARRIVVDRHGGELSIDSEPGRTVMRVTLPRRLAQD